MTETPSPPPPADTPTPHTIRTDRPCARCGFNLFGQQIVREPHYNLTAARCPECGQLAALQEYPALGKWADRWAKLIAAFWILALVAALFIQFGPTLGLSFAALENPRSEISYTIARAHADRQITLTEGPTQNTYTLNTYADLDKDWFAENKDMILDGTGGLAMVFNQEALAIWFPLAVISFAFGVFWSTALLGARRWAACAIALIPPAIALTFVFFISNERYFDPSILTPRDAATDIVRPVIVPATGIIIAISAAIGVILGRRVARLAVRLALPPRMRSALSILWTRDNLPPPTAKT